MDEAVVDPADTLEHYAHKQHGKHGRGDGQGLKEDSQHAKQFRLQSSDRESYARDRSNT
jgi:hypothetical protein